MKLLIPMAGPAGFIRRACCRMFVKAFGVTFLGHWRGHHNANVHEADWTMRTGMLLAAARLSGFRSAADYLY